MTPIRYQARSDLPYWLTRFVAVMMCPPGVEIMTYLSEGDWRRGHTYTLAA